MCQLCVAFAETRRQAPTNGSESILRLGSYTNFVQDVVDHLAQDLGFLGVEKKRALPIALDNQAMRKPFQDRRFSVRHLNAHGPLVRVDLDHPGRQCSARSPVR